MTAINCAWSVKYNPANMKKRKTREIAEVTGFLLLMVTIPLPIAKIPRTIKNINERLKIKTQINPWKKSNYQN